MSCSAHPGAFPLPLFFVNNVLIEMLLTFRGVMRRKPVLLGRSFHSCIPRNNTCLHTFTHKNKKNVPPTNQTARVVQYCLARCGVVALHLVLFYFQNLLRWSLGTCECFPSEELNVTTGFMERKKDGILEKRVCRSNLSKRLTKNKEQTKLNILRTS
jgi:hypothetical protein